MKNKCLNYLRTIRSGPFKVGYYRNLGGMRSLFETYTRYSGVDNEEQKKRF